MLLVILVDFLEKFLQNLFGIMHIRKRTRGMLKKRGDQFFLVFACGIISDPISLILHKKNKKLRLPYEAYNLAFYP